MRYARDRLAPCHLKVAEQDVRRSALDEVQALLLVVLGDPWNITHLDIAEIDHARLVIDRDVRVLTEEFVG